jgi:hypothetical protein
MPPHRVPCPTGGCAWCGVGTVLAKRSAKPWRPHSVREGVHTTGHLCPTCERIRADGGSMRSAVLGVIDPDRLLRRRMPGEPDVQGVRGWATAGDGRPNEAPWAHLDLLGLRDILARGDF